MLPPDKPIDGGGAPPASNPEPVTPAASKSNRNKYIGIAVAVVIVSVLVFLAVK